MNAQSNGNPLVSEINWVTCLEISEMILPLFLRALF